MEWPELETHLADPLIRGFFKRVDLEPWHLHIIIHPLCGNDERVNIGKFMDGLHTLAVPIEANRYDGGSGRSQAVQKPWLQGDPQGT